MTDLESYGLGTVVTVYGEWDKDGVPTDPNAVTLYVQTPAGVEVSYTSMAPHTTPAPPIVRTSAGRFEADIVPDSGGLWRYRWQGVGLADGAQDGQFWIEPSFVGPDNYTYDPTTPTGEIRLYIDDHDFRHVADANPRKRTAIFTDREINVFLTRAGNTFGAAALALRTIAVNKALLVQRRQIGKTDVDYGQLRSDLLKAAKEYQDQAVLIGEDYFAPADGIVEQNWNDFTFRDIAYNSQVREAQDL